ncbi:winged helix-turn-helix transcriptional regulator [Streptomyces minutiscleroticus]|uniref:Cinnamoyl ester hydrolase n=1 Tax=Streptomyces minutiscleroticus TaxID=68238 RepID=A0A918NS84_9ACTN|nr:helix-turn-helix domain-containing protein [Streptomyces minutiscleroticus]GGX90619.1 cinnamoyl ester hydrolase [Streptomyces minutiscleroticus]
MAGTARPRVPAQDHFDAYAANCPCRSVLDLLADKWSALALGALESGPLRFGAIRTRLEGISPKVLTAVLRRLEDSELVTRTVYPSVPLHVEYALTDLGRDACVPLMALRSWVEENIERFPARA